MATRSPDCAACQAVVMPRMPPPITSRSYVARPSRSRVSARPGFAPAVGCEPSAGTRCRVVITVSVLLFDPVHGPLHGLEPVLVLTVAVGRVHAGGPFGRALPVGTQRLGVRPEADRQTGRVGRAQTRG